MTTSSFRAHRSPLSLQQRESKRIRNMRRTERSSWSSSSSTQEEEEEEQELHQLEEQQQPWEIDVPSTAALRIMDMNSTNNNCTSSNKHATSLTPLLKTPTTQHQSSLSSSPFLSMSCQASEDRPDLIETSSSSTSGADLLYNNNCQQQQAQGVGVAQGAEPALVAQAGAGGGGWSSRWSLSGGVSPVDIAAAIATPTPTLLPGSEALGGERKASASFSVGISRDSVRTLFPYTPPPDEDEEDDDEEEDAQDDEKRFAYNNDFDYGPPPPRTFGSPVSSSSSRRRFRQRASTPSVSSPGSQYQQQQQQHHQQQQSYYHRDSLDVDYRSSYGLSERRRSSSSSKQQHHHHHRSSYNDSSTTPSNSNGTSNKPVRSTSSESSFFSSSDEQQPHVSHNNYNNHPRQSGKRKYHRRVTKSRRPILTGNRSSAERLSSSSSGPDNVSGGVAGAGGGGVGSVGVGGFAGMYRRLVKLVVARGLVWLLVLVGLVSVSMTILTNRTIAAQKRNYTMLSSKTRTATSSEPSLLATKTRAKYSPPITTSTDGTAQQQQAGSGPFSRATAGLRGQLLHGFGGGSGSPQQPLQQRELLAPLQQEQQPKKKVEKTKPNKKAAANMDAAHQHPDTPKLSKDKKTKPGKKSNNKKKGTNSKVDAKQHVGTNSAHENAVQVPNKPITTTTTTTATTSEKKSKQAATAATAAASTVLDKSKNQPSHLVAVVLPEKHLLAKPSFESLDRNLYEKALDRKGKHANADNKNNVELVSSSSASHRIVVLHDSMLDANIPKRHRKIQLYPPDFTDNTQLYGILSSDDERIKHTMEVRAPLDDGQCAPMKEWQTTFYPSCNSMHEVMDLAHLGDMKRDGMDFRLFGTKGYWRNAWSVQAPGNDRLKRDTVVLKTLKIEHRFEEAHFEHDRIDAVLMERLTKSPHVINIFGFCGHSVITEFGQPLRELVKASEKTSLARLHIARDIASGLADVHGIDGDGIATFVHLDVNPANVVSVDGTLKLNDFNIGILRRWNSTSNSPCGFPAQYPNPQWRSPEEARDEKNLTEKVDVFSMGHIFYRLICGHEPWNKLEPGGKPAKNEMNEKVKKGILPTIPVEVLQSTDPEIVTIRDAMLRCYTYNPEQRPSAREIVKTLQAELDRLENLKRWATNE